MSDSAELHGWTHVYSGKVRDLYVPNTSMNDDDTWTGDPLKTASAVLVIASNRISAQDEILSPEIPQKGAMLTALTNWWFAHITTPNHLIPDDEAKALGLPPVPASLIDRAMVCRPLNMLPVECVVRGFLTGSGWRQYQSTGAIGGESLPAGLKDGDRLPVPIFTPAWKAPQGQHDENINFERTIELVGEAAANEIRSLSLTIYKHAAKIAEEHGLILADTKFEFGINRVSGEITLADEVLTPDSSRYWDASAYANGASPEERMSSFDKEPVRTWLSANWVASSGDKPPELPDEVIAATQARYTALLERLTA